MKLKTADPPFAILFDMDGVLIDSAPFHNRAFPLVGARYGFTADEALHAHSRGGALRDYYDRLQVIRPFKVSFEQFANAMLEELFAHLEKHVAAADPALLQFLDRLQAHSIPIGVGTSALKRSAARKLAAVELHNKFEVIVTADDVERHKPYPDIYLEAARQLGVSPHKCIVIEDSPEGVSAARAAGMKVIGYTKYVPDSDSLDEADISVDHYDQLTHDKLLALIAGK